MARKFLLQILLMLLTLASLVNKELQQKFIVSSNGMLLKGNSTSRLAIKSLGQQFLLQIQSFLYEERMC